LLALRKLVKAVIPTDLHRGQLILRHVKRWEQAGAIFVHIPKNGGTSVNHALYGRFMGHSTAADIQRWAPKTFRKLPSVALSRNPWDRCLSAYRFARAGQGNDGLSDVGMTPNPVYQSKAFKSFERFVLEWLPNVDLLKEDHVFHPQLRFITKADATIVTHVGKIEEMASFENYVSELLGKPVHFGHVNHTSKGGKYQEHFSKKMAETIAEIYAADINKFDYKF
jgi:hypothetical protein